MISKIAFTTHVLLSLRDRLSILIFFGGVDDQASPGWFFWFRVALLQYQGCFVLWSDLWDQLKVGAPRRGFVNFWEPIVFTAKWHWSCASPFALTQTKNRVWLYSGVLDSFPHFGLIKKNPNIFGSKCLSPRLLQKSCLIEGKLNLSGFHSFTLKS
jgi:hypothetical protein